MSISFEESEKQCEEIKKHFQHLIGKLALIQISDKPMNEWVVAHYNSTHQLMEERGNLSASQQSFASFGLHEKGSIFQYSDENLLKIENLSTGELRHFSDRRGRKELLEQVKKELQALIKSCA